MIAITEIKESTSNLAFSLTFYVSLNANDIPCVSVRPFSPQQEREMNLAHDQSHPISISCHNSGHTTDCQRKNRYVKTFCHTHIN